MTAVINKEVYFIILYTNMINPAKNFKSHENNEHKQFFECIKTPLEKGRRICV